MFPLVHHLFTQTAVSSVHGQNLSVTVVGSVLQAGVTAEEFQVSWAPLSNLNAIFQSLANQSDFVALLQSDPEGKAQEDYKKLVSDWNRLVQQNAELQDTGRQLGSTVFSDAAELAAVFSGQDRYITAALTALTSGNANPAAVAYFQELSRLARQNGGTLCTNPTELEEVEQGKNAIISDLFSTFPWENSSVSASGGTGRRLRATGFFSDVRAFVVVCILALAIACCCCCCCLIRMSTAQFQNM